MSFLPQKSVAAATAVNTPNAVSSTAEALNKSNAVSSAARTFAQVYYAQLSNVANMTSFYSAKAMLTWQGKEMHGATNITTFLAAQLKMARLTPATVDGQETSGGLLVHCTGTIKNATGESNFTETFHLIPGAAKNSFQILNQLFRV
jgi:hypothetical protein